MNKIEWDSYTQNGKLKIFLGISSGVGKVNSMLAFAKKKKNEGKNVQIATSITGGNFTPDEKPFLIIPHKTVELEGVSYQELDLDKIIEYKPDIVLIDTLSPSNSPLARHPKRWQDILEILEHKIDVFVTLNIKHIESLRDDIELIIGSKITDSVPDSILEQASHIEIVDISPEEIKTNESPEKLSTEKLTALREILFRYSADKVEVDLESLILKTPKDAIWKTKDKILLAVGHGPYSEKLVRISKQLASRLKAPWIALYVDTGKKLGPDDEKKVMSNLDLARELGAHIVTVSETDLIKGIYNTCQQYDISQIVIGKPGRRPFLNIIKGGSIIEKLNRLPNNVSIHIVRTGYKKRPHNKIIFFNKILKKTPELLFITVVVGVLTLINSVLHHKLGILPYHSIGLLFLLEITLISQFFSLWPTLWASLLASQIWNVFFIPPLYNFSIESPDDVILCLSFIIIASVVGALTSTIKKNQGLLKNQEKRTNTLYRLSTDIVESKSRDEVLEKISQTLSSYFKGKVSITLKSKNGTVDYFKKGNDWVFNKPKFWEVVVWSFENAEVAGKWTNTIPSSKGICVPIIARDETLGVLAYIPENDDARLSISDREVLLTISTQLGLFLERDLFYERSLEAEKLKESEKLHQTLLNSVSHELKTPLTAIVGIVEAIYGKNEKDKEINELRNSLMESTDRLNQVVDNILDISRLESGILKLKEEWFDFNDIIDNVSSKLKYSLSEFVLEVKIPESFPLVFIDAKLMEQVFLNLFLNSVKYCPPRTKIVIEAIDGNEYWDVLYFDNGPGVSKEDESKIFDKFFRGEAPKTGGTGLGLTIVKSIVEHHNGSINTVKTDNGLKYLMRFPKYKAPNNPEENE